MSTSSPIAIDERPIPDDIWRLSIDRYHSMIASGNLTEDDRVELLDGVLVEKTTKNPPHTVATQLLDVILSDCVPSGWIVRKQEPITLNASEPEPDLAVVRGEVRDFTERHPAAGEVGLVVEIADASLARDRGTKRKIYADARIPMFWIVNLIDRQIEVFANPFSIDGEYTYPPCRAFAESDRIDIVISGQVVRQIAVRDCLP